MKNLTILILLFGVILFLACGDNTEDLVSGGDTDPIENISYADRVQPIFNTTCGGSGCHTSGGNASGVNLSGHSQVLNSVGVRYGGNIVIAGNADSSPLVDKIEPSPEHGSRMPLGGSPLSTSQIQTIRTWIDEGALNN